MRALRIVARGFRNLASLDVSLPPGGGILLGPNGHGKTNFLELLSYPVLFRSLRGARDVDLVRHDGEGGGFHLSLEAATAEGDRVLEAAFVRDGRSKRIAVDGVEPERVTDVIGCWLAVVFLPSDLRLVSGGAMERRQYLDRLLSLADGEYLRALRRYRSGLKQRNAALRQHRPDAASAFDRILASTGARIISRRMAWVAENGPRFAEECARLGEPLSVTLEYGGRTHLAEGDAWTEALARSRSRDAAAGGTTIGPHRDDLVLLLEGAPMRAFGSTGQQRTAAVALKLLERDTLWRARGTEPALLLDDVFAELDRDRQERLAERIAPPPDGDRQVFITAPREDELPPGVSLPVFRVKDGQVIAEIGSLVG